MGNLKDAKLEKIANHGNGHYAYIDNILEAGIMAAPGQRAGWKNIFYGEHNQAAPEKLYWEPQAGE